MSKIKISAIGAAIAFAAMTPAIAAEGFTNDIRSMPQVNLATVYSDLSLYAKWVGGNVRATSAAIGNNFVAEAAGTTLWRNDQLQPYDVGATLTATVKGVGGDVDLSAVGICNNASLNVTEAGYTEAWSHQRCSTYDPYAVLEANVFGVDGSVGLTSAAIANNLSIDAQTASLSAAFAQANAAATYASVNATVVDVAGDVTASAVAIGNNASITGRFK